MNNKIHLIHDQMSNNKILTIICTIPPFIPTQEVKLVFNINIGKLWKKILEGNLTSLLIHFNVSWKSKKISHILSLLSYFL